MNIQKKFAARVLHTVVATSLVASLGVFSTPSLAQEAADLGRITTTGTRIRRVDIATASPVFVVDRQTIENSGAVTLGQLIQELPSIAGAGTNPGVNNGGGDGASEISLRGLTSDRTLLLLNGRRMVTLDVNSIPINMVERVEVLKDGASAIYGSDAVGGVVNFITRKNFEGAQAGAQYGVSSRNDGDLYGVNANVGFTGAKGYANFGFNYDERDAISSADRAFSDDPVALAFGETFTFGSSRVPNGLYSLTRDQAASLGYDLTAAGCPADDPSTANNLETVAFTRIDGAAGTDPADFRCYVGGGPGNDSYNFQGSNKVIIPQERWGMFMQGEYDISNSVTAYTEALYHNTTANNQFAPEPFDASFAGSGVTVSADNEYNPFGFDLTDVRRRLLELGDRTEQYDIDRLNLTTGLKGELSGGWAWDAYYTHAEEKQTTEARGELFVPALQSALGPTGLDTNGNLVCGTPDGAGNVADADVIAGCTPIDFFGPTANNLTSDAQAALASIAPGVIGKRNKKLKVFSANITGDIAELPAGPVGMAFGTEYRKNELDDIPDFLRQQGFVSGNQAGAAVGKFDVSEFYSEWYVPLLADRGFAQSLDLELGVRYSDYSNFGDTTNSKVGVQWRPNDSWLIRGTYADVFRAPTLDDLFSAQSESADQYTDPCNGTTALLGANANIDEACENVSRGGAFMQNDSQANVLVGGNTALNPEEGETLSVGFIYNPSWLASAEFGVDYFQYELENTIGVVGIDTILDQCFNNGTFCDQFTRDALGNITSVNDTTQNIGLLDAEGVDMSFKYNFGETDYGRVRLGLDTTYIIKWDNQIIAGLPGTLVNNAGTFREFAAGGDGHYSRWRGLGYVDWNMGNISIGYTGRYIGHVNELPFDFGTEETVIRKVGSQLISDIVVNYDLPESNTRLTFGVDNVTDQLAPLIIEGFNGTTDMRTYDGIGRFFFVRAQVTY